MNGKIITYPTNVDRDGMTGKIIIYSTDVHRDVDAARRGVITAAEPLGIEVDCRLSSAWVIHIEKEDRATFLELAREEANR